MSRFSSFIQSQFNKKVKGGALFIAILISIIVGILLCMFIMLANFNQRSVTNLTQSSQLYYNLKSAFEIAQSDYFTEESNNKWIKNSTNDDSIKIKKTQWGAYILINAQTKNRHHSLSQAGLYGTYMTADSGLVVSDNSRPIGLSGNIVFKASCYLPKSVIKPAYIEGQSYIGSAQNSGFIKSSPVSISEINESILKKIKEQKNVSVYNDSSVSGVLTNTNHSFNKKTILWQTPSVKLSNLNLKNNIKIMCSGNIEIDSSCHFDNILIVCSKIKFKQGFKGSVHVLAEDSIITEKKCEFQYPSSFTLLADGSSENNLCSIIMEEDCVFFGGMIAVNNNSSSNSSKVFIKLNAKSEVNGFIYSNNYTHVEGKLNATVITNALLLKTPSAVYENHILGCEIDPKKYAPILAIPLLFKNNSKLQCCKKVNI